MEIGQRAEIGMHRLMAAGLAANGPGAAGISRCARRVVTPLVVAYTNGMNRRQIEHIEAHLGDIGQPGHAGAEAAVLAGYGCCRAREKLVPGREASALAVDDHAL